MYYVLETNNKMLKKNRYKKYLDFHIFICMKIDLHVTFYFLFFVFAIDQLLSLGKLSYGLSCSGFYLIACS